MVTTELDDALKQFQENIKNFDILIMTEMTHVQSVIESSEISHSEKFEKTNRLHDMVVLQLETLIDSL